MVVSAFVDLGPSECVFVVLTRGGANKGRGREREAAVRIYFHYLFLFAWALA